MPSTTTGNRTFFVKTKQENDLEKNLEAVKKEISEATKNCKGGDKSKESEVAAFIKLATAAEEFRKDAAVSKDEVNIQYNIDKITDNITEAIKWKLQASGYFGVIELTKELTTKEQTIIEETEAYINIKNFDEAIKNQRKFLAAKQHPDLYNTIDFNKAIKNQKKFLEAKEHTDLSGKIIDLELAIENRKGNSDANIDESLFGKSTFFSRLFTSRSIDNKKASDKINEMIDAERERDIGLFGANNVLNKNAVKKLDEMIDAKRKRDINLFGVDKVEHNKKAVKKLKALIDEAIDANPLLANDDKSLLEYLKKQRDKDVEDLADRYYKVGGFKKVKKFWGDLSLGKDTTKEKEKEKEIEDKEKKTEENYNSAIKEHKEKEIKKQELEKEKTKITSEIVLLQNKDSSSRELRTKKEELSNIKAASEKLTLEIDNLEVSIFKYELHLFGLEGVSEHCNKEAKKLTDKIEVLEEEKRTLKAQKEKAAKERDESLTNWKSSKLEGTKDSPVIFTTKKGGATDLNKIQDKRVKQYFESAGKIVTDLFSLAENDLVPEVARAKIRVDPISADSARVYVAFGDRNDAIAFCSKMNKFEYKTGHKIIPDVKFTDSYDKKSETTTPLEEIRSSYYKNTIPRFFNSRYDIPNLENSYVVTFEVCDSKKPGKTSLDFVQDITNSEKANSIVKDVEERRLVKEVSRERDVERKYSGIKFATGLLGATPLVAGVAATLMYFLSSFLSKVGCPGSTLFAAVNQTLFDVTEATLKEYTIFSLFPDESEYVATYCKKASKEIQRVQEKEAARGLSGWRILENSIMKPVTIVTTALAFISNFSGALFNGFGDIASSVSRKTYRYAGKEWSRGGWKSIVPVVGSFIASGLSYLGSQPCYATGLLLSGLGKAFSKPAEYNDPEGSVKENRARLHWRMGRGIREGNKFFEGYRETNQQSLKLSTLKIDVLKIDVLTKEELKEKEKLVNTISRERVKEELFKSVSSVAFDVRDPIFNKRSGVKEDNERYLEVLKEVKFKSSGYRVLMNKDGSVVVTELGVAPRSEGLLPESLENDLPGFYIAVLRSLASKKEQMVVDTPGVSMREYALLLNGKPAVEMLKQELPSDYTKGEVHSVERNKIKEKYYIQITYDDKIKIGRSKESMKEVKDAEALHNIDLRKAVSSLKKASSASKSTSGNPSQLLQSSNITAVRLASSTEMGLDKGDGSSGKIRLLLR